MTAILEANRHPDASGASCPRRASRNGACRRRCEQRLALASFSEMGLSTDDGRAGGSYDLILGLSGEIGRRKEMTSTSSQAFEATKIHCSY